MWINVDREGGRFRTLYKTADWKASYTIGCQDMTIPLDEQLMTGMYALGGTTGSVMNHNTSHVMGLTTNITMGHKTSFMGITTRRMVGKRQNGPYNFFFKS